MKVLVTMGTRPEVMKLAPVCMEMASRGELEPRLLITGQHREIVDGALASFGLQPHYDLDIMQPEQDLFEITGRVLAGLRPVLEDFAPHWIVVQGDTTSTFASALAGYYRKTKVAHVEAGLRTGRRYAPFPEELNRRMAACLADLHFAPTGQARANLLKEGISEDAIHVVGNTVIDALRWVLAHRRPGPAARQVMDALGQRACILVTCHRREIWGEPMAAVMSAVNRLAREHPGLAFVFPVHPNPGVRQAARRELSGLDNVLLTEPMDYADFAHLLNGARFVLTDSGGVQEEAAALGKPAIVLRAATERMEGVTAGAAVVAGTDPARIHELAHRLATDPACYASMARPADVYGDGHAARRIVDVLCALSRSGVSGNAPP